MSQEFWQRPRTILRWMITQWCNYDCWYCRQDHARDQVYRGAKGHWADNAPVDRWLGAISHHFRSHRLNLHITGGETMLDKENMFKLLMRLHQMDFVETIRIDTNASWSWDTSFKSKVRLMVSYHPSETTDEVFFAKLDQLRSRDWNVEVVSYVVYADRIGDIARMHKAVTDHGIALNVLPAFGRSEFFSEEDVKELRKYISEKDWPNRFQDSTFQKDCLFPGIAYEMYPSGEIHVGCHDELKGSIFDEKLPDRMDGYSPCPHQKCYCEDKYMFLKEVGGAEVAQYPLEALASRIPLRVL